MFKTATSQRKYISFLFMILILYKCRLASPKTNISLGKLKNTQQQPYKANAAGVIRETSPCTQRAKFELRAKLSIPRKEGEMTNRVMVTANG